jgi:peptide/nickel transport system substrate-binding protein
MPREEIKKKLFKDLPKLAVGPFPSISPKSDPNLRPLKYDLEKAKALLKEAGWTDSNNDGVLDNGDYKMEFQLLIPQGVKESERIALIYQQELKKLKVNISLKQLEWTVFIKQILERKYEATMLGWGSSLDSDPYQIWHSSQIDNQGSNHIAFNNKRVDEILEQARQTLDKGARDELYQEFSRIIADEQPYLFLFERPHLFIGTKRFWNVDKIGKLGLDSSLWFTPPGLEKYKEVAKTN